MFYRVAKFDIFHIKYHKNYMIFQYIFSHFFGEITDKPEYTFRAFFYVDFNSAAVAATVMQFLPSLIFLSKARVSK